MLTDIRALADHFLIALPNINTCYPLLKAKCSQTSVSYLSLMNPWLYLLSTICAYPCYFPPLQSTRKS